MLILSTYTFFSSSFSLIFLIISTAKVKKFLVGRQFFVIFVVFLIAQLTSFPGIPPDFAGMPPLMVLVLIQTGLPGVALTLTVGQLISQIYVEEFTMQFLNLPGCEFCIRLSLYTEYIGVCNTSWLLYHLGSNACCGNVIKAREQMRTQDMALVTNSASATEEAMSPTTKNRGADFDTGLHEHEKEPFTWFDGLKVNQ